jgi:hypothetical protein
MGVIKIPRTKSGLPALNPHMSTQALPMVPRPQAVLPPVVTVLPLPKPPALPPVKHLVKLPWGVIDFDRAEIRHEGGRAR